MLNNIYDIDVVAYFKMIGKNIEINERNGNSKISFNVDATNEELDQYYLSDFRKFKMELDLIKKMITNNKVRS